MQSSFLSSTRALFARIAMSRNKLFVVAWLALVLYPQLLMAQEKRAASPSTGTVEDPLSVFIAAFDNLDWPAFRECFSSIATVFHPSAPNVRRVDTPEQFEKAWLGVFERIKRSSGRNAPPYMDLKPLDLRVENLSDDVTLGQCPESANARVHTRD